MLSILKGLPKGITPKAAKTALLVNIKRAGGREDFRTFILGEDARGVIRVYWRDASKTDTAESEKEDFSALGVSRAWRLVKAKKGEYKLTLKAKGKKAKRKSGKKESARGKLTKK